MEFEIRGPFGAACGDGCEYNFAWAPAEEYKGVLFVLTLIAGSGRQKPGNPAAISGRLIDSGETERRRAFVIVSFTEFIT